MVSTIMALALSATLTCHSLQIAEVAPLSDANAHVASGPSGTVTVENTPLITERQVKLLFAIFAAAITDSA